MNFGDFMTALEDVGEGIITGAANSSAPLQTIDPTHPVATAAVEAGQIAGKALGAAGLPLPQFAALALQVAQMFVQFRAPAPTEAVPATGQ